MSCGFPGCSVPPDGEPVQVKATRTDTLSHLPLRRLLDDETEVPPGVALMGLCPTHRAEFERLGWLAPGEEDEEC